MIAPTNRVTVTFQCAHVGLLQHKSAMACRDPISFVADPRHMVACDPAFFVRPLACGAARTHHGSTDAYLATEPSIIAIAWTQGASMPALPVNVDPILTPHRVASGVFMSACCVPRC